MVQSASSVKVHETVVSQRTPNSPTTSLSKLESTQKVEPVSEKRPHHHHSHHHKPKAISLKNIDKYQVEISALVLALLVLLNNFELFKPYTSPFLTLQHKYEGIDRYDIGLSDIYLIITGIFIATFIRTFTMNFILRPIATSLNIRSSKAIQRFEEQGWYLIYYIASFSFGFYNYCGSEYFLNMDYFFIDWPHDQMTGIFKVYYLFELACWLQQIFILNIEERRKDHIQMFSHHIITCLLVTGSYYYYFTRIGHVILIIMDVVDIFLSTAKVLKYCGFQVVCDWMFGFFLLSWIVVRHGVYNLIFYHTATKSKSLMMSGKCMPGLEQKRCWTDNVITVFLSLLGGLQIITSIWMYLIAKVAIKVVTGKGAEDVRSDDEDEDDELMNQK